MSGFKFKRFAVEQEGVAMKLTTDSVLVGAWAGVRGDEKAVLDVGTGCGVIALMLAQRTERCCAKVDAIDIDGASCRAAIDNAACSPWGARVSVANVDIEEFATTHTDKYDLVVSNPPFFADSLLSPDVRRSGARHTVTMTFDVLASCAKQMLRSGGMLAVIVPADAAKRMRFAAACAGLSLARQCDVVTNENGLPKRAMLEFISADSGVDVEESVLVMRRDGRWSREYINLTGDFYLNM